MRILLALMLSVAALSAFTGCKSDDDNGYDSEDRRDKDDRVNTTTGKMPNPD
ncbi:MAG TPA: hypothetical protein VFB66_31875 [Tepidisphaeraceae bacterium]|nr:hypothetical protein [Tepidisphaeraceae bacterium]